MEATLQMENGTMTIVGQEWKKGDQHRIYFSIKAGTRNSGQACWDVKARNWIKVHTEFGPAFKDRIAAAFDLGELC